MSTLLTTNLDYVLDGTSRRVSMQLVDCDGDSIAKSVVTSLTLSIVDCEGNYINSRNGQDILDTNGGSLSSAGVLTLKLSTADNALQSTSESKEYHKHRVLWQFTDDDAETQTNGTEFTLEIRGLGA